MKFSQNGYDFTDEINTVQLLNKYCKEKKVKARVFLVSKGDYKKFLIFDDEGLPVYEDGQFEGICVHIDIMALNRQIR